MIEPKHLVDWPGWVTEDRICGQGSGSIWKLSHKETKETATVKYISIPDRAHETEQLMRQGKTLEEIAEYYNFLSRSVDTEYESSKDLKGCRHVAMYRDMLKIPHAGGLGWTILLMMDNLTPIDRCLTAPDEAQVLKLGRQVCMALEDSNRQDLLHGSITPRCIFRDETGNYQLGGFRSDSIGAMGDFRAPEAVENAFVDTRADVFSLGMVLYWLLNDRILPGKDRQGPKNGSKKLKAVIMKAIAPNAADRYRNAAEFRQALDAIAFIKPDIKTKPRKPKKLMAIAAILLLLVGIGGGIFAGWSMTRKYTLMADHPDVGYEDMAGAPVFGNKYQRSQIRSVTFLNSIKNAPSDSWDVSQERNGTVLAWVQPNGNLYDLYIAAKRDIRAPEDCKKLFAGYENLQQIHFNDAFKTGHTTNMSSMFYNCGKLQQLDVSCFDTSNVTAMNCMFYGCGSLTELDLSHFQTSQVTDMRSMFHGCSQLTKLDISRFDTAKVTNMYCMFFDCENLIELNVSGFDTSNVTAMECMFYNCKNLRILDVSGFDTSKVTSLYCMFYNCNNLSVLDVTGFDTSKATNMMCMFYNCGNLLELDVSGFDTSNVTTMYCMFYGCRSLRILNVAGFNTSKVTDMYCMFHSCRNLNTLDVSRFKTSNVTNMIGMFYDCTSLKSIAVSGFDVSKVQEYDNFMNGDRTINGRPWREFFQK